MLVRLGLAASAVLLLCAVVGGTPRAQANGVPQLVKLAYLEGISNWGPKDAEGVLEFSFAEAYARVDVKGLKPQEGFTYEGWLLSRAGTPLKVGDLRVGASGVGTIDTRLEKLEKYDYNTFVVAVRAAAEGGTTLPAQKSIAGSFVVIGADAAPGARGDVRPGVLPDTGEAPPLSTMGRIVRSVSVMLIAAVGCGIVMALARRRRGPA